MCALFPHLLCMYPNFERVCMLCLCVDIGKIWRKITENRLLVSLLLRRFGFLVCSKDCKFAALSVKWFSGLSALLYCCCCCCRWFLSHFTSCRFHLIVKFVVCMSCDKFLNFRRSSNGWVGWWVVCGWCCYVFRVVGGKFFSLVSVKFRQSELRLFTIPTRVSVLNCSYIVYIYIIYIYIFIYIFLFVFVFSHLLNRRTKGNIAKYLAQHTKTCDSV